MRGIIKKLGRGVRSVFRRRWVRRLSVSLVIIGVLVGIGAYALHYVDEPTQGTITAVVPTNTVKPVTQVSLHGTYADFVYPRDFQVSPVGAGQPPQIANYSFVSHAGQSVVLGVQILSIPSGILTEDNSYNYRKVTTAQFKQDIKVINGQNIYIMTDITTPIFNKTAFFSHAGKVASVNINGGGPEDLDKLDATLTAVVSSWQWH
jgi:hypothetical protein